ncbi:MAG: nucleotidyltransferase domain-containing protein [Leptospiraceae bacterium]|nr:nucleotidyltransferase domain-containing protein [Leptospiraceae bacterium]
MKPFPNPHYTKAIPIFESFPQIQVVYLFGSHASGKTHAESDLDFGFMAESNIKDDLSLKLIKAGFGEFSLVYMPEATLLLQFEIVKWNNIVYQKRDYDPNSFYSKTLRMYFDMEYYKEIQRKYLKERILHGE